MTDVKASIKKDQKKVLDALANVVGDQFSEDSIERGGTKIKLPARMGYRRAAQHLLDLDEAEETFTEYVREYRYRPWDVAAATDRAIKRVTGTTGLAKGEQSFFGSTPPARITVPVGPDEYIEVPWGTIEVPLFEGSVRVSGMSNENYGQIGVIVVGAKKRYRPAVQGLFEVIEDELAQRSIYRGKAITGGDNPEFVDLSAVNPDHVVYSQEVLAQLETSVFSGLRWPEAMRANEVPEKRSVLLTGQYGTGKTLALMLIGQEATANGVTFILVRPGKDNPFECMKTAQLYAPAVVAIEDVDTFGGTSADRNVMSELLDAFDGIQAKGKPILNVVTTNHPEKITKGMLRPGRLDALIEIGQLDLPAVTKLVTVLANGTLDHDVDFEQVFEKMKGYLPAFIAESMARAKRASIVRGEGVLLPLSTNDIVTGAMSLRPQFEMMHRADEHKDEPTLDLVLRNIVSDGVKRADAPNWAVELEHEVGNVISG